MKKKIVISLALSLLLLASTACSTNKTEGDKNQSSQGTVSETVSSEPEVVKKPANPLTGEEVSDQAITTYRPVAIMVNNIKPALPQRGISQADVIYEMPVEGGVTRLMALFSDYKSIPEVGSVRSARHDYVELVKPLDALYVHIGWSESAKAAVEKENILDLNGLQYSNVAFYKDEQRAKTRSSEHCWFTDAKLIEAGIEKIGVDMQTTPKSLFTFAEPDQDIMATATGALIATDVKLATSPGVSATFTFDPATKKYAKTQYGAPHLDETANEAISLSNVFLMYTDVSMMSDNYHREIDLSKGSGYYLSMGKAIPVTYKKADVNSLIEVFDATGSPLTVNAGNSYFAIIPKTEEKNLVLNTPAE